MPDILTHHRACNLCEAACGLEIEHDGAQVLRIKGHQEDPISRGHICPKAVAPQDLHVDPDRLRQPMKRIGDSWQPIAWQQAFTEIGTRMAALQQQHGNDAMGLYIGNPNAHSHGNVLMALPLIAAMDTRNRYSAGSVDQLPMYVALYKLFGHYGLLPVPDLDRVEHMICLGGNPMASNGSIMAAPDMRARLGAIRERGQLIVIDPRRTETADMASEHIFIRPDSDAELTAAMLHVLFRDRLTKAGVLENILDGVPALQQAVLPFTPARAETATGIPAARIEQLVHEFAAAPRAVMYSRLGACTQQQGSLVQFLVLAFNLLTGRVDAEGGFMFPAGAVDLAGTAAKVGETGSHASYHAPASGLPETNGEYPVTALADEVLGAHDNRLRGLYVIAGNPASSNPNSGRMNTAMAKLELLVCQDYYISETSRHAHYILPPSSPLERPFYPLITNIVGIRNSANYADALFQPAPETLDDWQIMLGIRSALNLAKAKTRLQKIRAKAEAAALNRLGADGMLELLLRSGPYGLRKGREGLSIKKLRARKGTLDLGALQPGRLPGLLATPDKRIKLAPPEFLGELQQLADSQPDIPGDELRLIGRRHVRSNNSWLHNSRRLVKGKPRCTAQIHPEDAKRMNISDGCQVRLTSRVGSIDLPAEITDSIMPGVISVPHGWSQAQPGVQQRVAAAAGGANLNDITDERRVDRLSGTAAFSGQPVTLQAVAAEAAA